MKVITFQHAEVVKSITEKGVYLCNYTGEYHKRTPKSYEFLKEQFKYKYPQEPIIYPIFGWSQVFSEATPIDDTDPDTIKRMMEMTAMPEDYYMIVLDVPEDKVMETDFYGFVDLRCSEEFPYEDPELTDEGLKAIIRPREGNIIEIQAILGMLDKDWVMKITPLSEVTI